MCAARLTDHYDPRSHFTRARNAIADKRSSPTTTRARPKEAKMPNSSQYPRHDGSKGAGAGGPLPSSSSCGRYDEGRLSRRVSRIGELEGWIKGHLDAAFYSGIDEHSRPRAHHGILQKATHFRHAACPGSTFLGCFQPLRRQLAQSYKNKLDQLGRRTHAQEQWSAECVADHPYDPVRHTDDRTISVLRRFTKVMQLAGAPPIERSLVSNRGAER